MRSPLARAGCATLLALAASAGHADALLDYAYAGADCTPDPTAIAVHGALLRVDMRGAGTDSSLIYDGVEQYATALDHTQRIASPIELDDEALDFQTDVASASGTRMGKEMDKVQAMMAQAQEQMQAQCAELERQGMQCPQMPDMDLAALMQPENLQAMQQQGMAEVDPATLAGAGIDPADLPAQAQQPLAAGPRGASTIVIGALGTDRVGGIACTQWERRSGERVLQRGCSAEVTALQLEARDQRGVERGYARLMKLQQAFQPMLDQLDARMGTATAQANEEPQGVVLRLACFDAGGRETGSATLRVSHDSLPASTFEMPAGYRSPAAALREDAGGQGR